MNKRIFVEKKEIFSVERDEVLKFLESSLGVKFDTFRMLNVYDIFDTNEKELQFLTSNVIGTKNKDNIYEQIELEGFNHLALEYLSGTFDVRAKSCVDCLNVSFDSKASIYTSTLYIFDKNINVDLVEKILLNKNEMQVKNLNILEPNNKFLIKNDEIIQGFTDYSNEQLENFCKKYAMSIEDLHLIHNYFKTIEKRNPSNLELSLFDTYWSDHCRHTTFNTKLNVVKIEDEYIRKAYDEYLEITTKSEVSFMDLASAYAKYVIKNKIITDIEISDEVNACSTIVDVKTETGNEKWLLMFKNETHNHPTEIEPFGGASTCVGGAIRDPLSGRAYVYQAMRIAGSGNPLQKVSETLENKLPQITISKISAKGNSSYGNQIGLTTSFVKEIFHPGYIAKHMELGAVVGAVKYENIKREKPQIGDVVLMLGGKTGREGIGGATGSSIVHDDETLTTKSSEVQKGNPIEERKIQRLFRQEKITKLIKKANDFGAGGVCVAVGELARGIVIDLDSIVLKNSSMNAFEIALSESQERMAVVVSINDAQTFIKYAETENIKCVKIATITNDNRLIMKHKGKEIVNISYDFLDTNGYQRQYDVSIQKQNKIKNIYATDLLKDLKDLNLASQKGLAQMFDNTIGNSTAIAQYGGKNMLSESDVSAQYLPTKCKTISVMSYGFDPYVMSDNPYIGATYAVVDSIAKLVAAGCKLEHIKISMQEYFKSLKTSDDYASVMSALLGALRVQKAFNIPSIGGKDSMSGTYKDLNVPPTLVSFAITTIDDVDLISTDLKSTNSKLYLLDVSKDENDEIDYSKLITDYTKLNKYVSENKIKSMKAVDRFGVEACVAKMAMGNGIGVRLDSIDNRVGFGKIVIESSDELDFPIIGATNPSTKLNSYELTEIISSYTSTFSEIYRTTTDNITNNLNKIKYQPYSSSKKFIFPTPKLQVNILLPIFSGTNCEYDIRRAFELEGVNIREVIIKDLDRETLIKSINELNEAIIWSDIIVFSGGFSASDEPDGSGKFIANIIKSVKKEIEEHLAQKKLILGICNGFQGLVESGLLPFGKIKELDEDSPVLFKNDLNSHISSIVSAVICSDNSPWLAGYELGKNYSLAISHGEGKFVANESLLTELEKNGQIFSRYSDGTNATMDSRYNPNGSFGAIEGILSPDGLILGKMGHNERANTIKNIYGEFDQKLFLNAISYIKGGN